MTENYRLCRCKIRKGENKFVWKLTDKCNLNCLHCDDIERKDDLRKELSYEKSLELVYFLSKFKPLKLVLTGGEPLLKENFHDIAEYAKVKLKNVSLCTNGLINDSETIEKILELNFSNISISADSDRPKEHDELRGIPGSFEKTKKFVSRIREHSNDFTIFITLNPLNIDRAIETVSYWKGFTPDIEVGTLIERNENFSLKQIQNYSKKLPEVMKNLMEKHNVTIVGYPNSCFENLCPNGFSLFEISSNGDFSDCYWKTGAIRKPVAYKKLLKSKDINDLRDNIQQKYLESKRKEFFSEL
ncbi:MAG: radical SAM protein [archaeon]